MYETPVNSFIKELVQKFSDPEALAAAGKGALADRIALLQRHLTTLQQTFQQIRDVTNAQNISIEQKGLAEEFLDVAHPFKRLLKSCAEANDTGEVPSAENLCELERLAWVEFRVFMGEVFAVQVEVAPARSRDRTEIVRDSWAGGDAHSSAPPARRASNAGPGRSAARRRRPGGARARNRAVTVSAFLACPTRARVALSLGDHGSSVRRRPRRRTRPRARAACP